MTLTIILFLNYSHLASPGMFIKYYYILNEMRTERDTSLYELTSKLLEKYKKEKKKFILIVLNFFRNKI